MAASGFKGMGAVLHDGGCTFRVWAPNARAVRVVHGTAGLGKSAALDRDGNGSAGGYWSTFVSGVKADDQYRFEIDTVGGGQVRKLDPYGRTATAADGNSVVCDTRFDWGAGEAGWKTPGWNELVIYEIHVGSFNVTSAGQPGTFQGIIDRLDHLVELGVNAIQLMPAFEFNDDNSVGYNPALPFALESAYGKPHVMQELVRHAHRKGIAVIFDVVYNHWGPDQLDDCLWQFDGWSQRGLGGIYFYQDDRKFTPWGDRPDFGRPEVRQFIRDNALMLTEEYRADGLRWDSTACCRMNRGFCDGHCCGEGLGDGWNLMRWVNDEIKWRQPWKITIAEDLNGLGAITTPTPAGGAGFGSQWDSDFLHPVRRAALAPFDGGRDMHAVARALYHRFQSDATSRVIYVESHNEASNQRLPDAIAPGAADGWFAKKRATLAAGVLFTAPGIPMIFQGQEMLEWDRWSDRTPFDWAKLQRHRGLYHMFRDLIRLRRNWFDNTRGLRGQNVNVFHVNDADKLIAYHRWADGGPGDDVVVVANFADRAYPRYNVGFPRGGTWWVRFNSDWRGYDAGFGAQDSYDTTAHWGPRDGLSFQADVGIAPYSVAIFSQ
jgi:1,4-alpha-glucan branching enzyme